MSLCSIYLDVIEQKTTKDLHYILCKRFYFFLPFDIHEERGKKENEEPDTIETTVQYCTKGEP